jgi:GMP synthase-like glutamine amidotransferase
MIRHTVIRKLSVSLCVFVRRFIRDVYRIRRPLVGICFGHQIIARALGR